MSARGLRGDATSGKVLHVQAVYFIEQSAQRIGTHPAAGAMSVRKWWSGGNAGGNLKGLDGKSFAAEQLARRSEVIYLKKQRRETSFPSAKRFLTRRLLGFDLDMAKEHAEFIEAAREPSVRRIRPGL